MPTYLTPEQISAILEGEQKQLSPPIYVGPISWVDTTLRCAFRGCSSPTYCKVEGIPYCGIHALLILNYMVIQCHSDYEDVSYPQEMCTCKTGHYRMMNAHTSDCALYPELKEKRDKISGDSRTHSDSG